MISTALYFIVFGSAIGSRIVAIEGQLWGFYCTGTHYVNSSDAVCHKCLIRDLFSKFIGTIYEPLSAPVSYFEIVVGYVGQLPQVLCDWVDYSGDFIFVCACADCASLLDAGLFAADLPIFSLLIIIGIWARNFEQLNLVRL